MQVPVGLKSDNTSLRVIDENRVYIRARIEYLGTVPHVAESSQDSMKSVIPTIRPYLRAHAPSMTVHKTLPHHCR
jgi:hypothetical protein